MKSMTGYGKATILSNNRELTVELKSVNHRFLDLNIKMPKLFNAFESTMRTAIGEVASRGHIDVYVTYNNHSESDKEVLIDYAMAQALVDASSNISDKFALKNNYATTDVMRFSDVIRVVEKAEDDDMLKDMLITALQQALEQLDNMRIVEGRGINADISSRLNNISQLLTSIKEYAPQVSQCYRDKLIARITEVLGNVNIDDNKLYNEVAFFVDKSNIDEEISRLSCHIDNANSIMQANGSIGRKLDFLIQEFNRESNTICSKSNDINLTNIALELKNEVEKVREQVQNIE